MTDMSPCQDQGSDMTGTETKGRCLAVASGLARAGVHSVVFEKKARLNLHSRATLILPPAHSRSFGNWGCSTDSSRLETACPTSDCANLTTIIRSWDARRTGGCGPSASTPTGR